VAYTSVVEYIYCTKKLKKELTKYAPIVEHGGIIEKIMYR
jgi:hypothetical protein